MKIEDDFLNQNVFDEFQAFIMGQDIFWNYTTEVDYVSVESKTFMFYHMFQNAIPCSPYFEKITPLLVKINPISLLRIKANLLTRTPNIIENTFHIDESGWPEEKLKRLTTSIFYVNTNNGYTKFEDGTIVESVANRMISFPADMLHTGTSCTDESIRVVINFNYLK